MPGKNVREKRATKHNQYAGKETRGSGEIPLFHPTKHECANGENMQSYRPVDRDRRGQKQKEPIRRIQQRSLHPTEIRRSTKDMRITESEISIRYFSEYKLAPREVLQEHIAA